MSFNDHINQMYSGQDSDHWSDYLIEGVQRYAFIKIRKPLCQIIGLEKKENLVNIKSSLTVDAILENGRVHKTFWESEFVAKYSRLCRSYKWKIRHS